jgi:hypothetical protein
VAAGRARVDRLLHLVDQRLRVERLVGVVVRAGFLAARLVVRSVAAREQDDRGARLLRAELLGEPVAVLASEARVDDDRVGLADFRHGRGRAFRGDDSEVIARESDLQGFAHRDAVIDGEQGFGHDELLTRGSDSGEDHVDGTR